MADSLTPNPWQVDPATGALVYERVELYAASADPGAVTPPDERRVRWIQESDGELVADITGWEGDGAYGHNSYAYQPGFDRLAGLNLLVSDVLGVKRASVVAHTGIDGSEHTATVLDGSGQSSFLRLANPALAKRSIAFGTTAVTFTASQFTPVVNVAHGLGVVPIIALATMQHSIIGWCNAVPASNVNVALQGLAPAALSVTAQVYWLAIG